MSLSNKERERIVKGRKYVGAYSHMTDMGWWAEASTTDEKRELFLYRDFMEYYDLLTVAGVYGLKDDPSIIIRNLKIELDRELKKVKRHIYNMEEVS